MCCLYILGQFNINTLFLYSVFKPALCVSAAYTAAMGYTRLAAGAQNFWVFCKERLERSKHEKNHRVGFNSHQ